MSMALRERSAGAEDVAGGAEERANEGRRAATSHHELVGAI